MSAAVTTSQALPACCEARRSSELPAAPAAGSQPRTTRCTPQFGAGQRAAQQAPASECEQGRRVRARPPAAGIAPRSPRARRLCVAAATSARGVGRDHHAQHARRGCSRWEPPGVASARQSRRAWPALRPWPAQGVQGSCCHRGRASGPMTPLHLLATSTSRGDYARLLHPLWQRRPRRCTPRTRPGRDGSPNRSPTSCSATPPAWASTSGWRMRHRGFARACRHARDASASSRQDDLAAIERGMAQIRGEIERGEFTWQLDLEDVHLNIEKRLTELVGDAGKRLHTGRSRNDQVAHRHPPVPARRDRRHRRRAERRCSAPSSPWPNGTRRP